MNENSDLQIQLKIDSICNQFAKDRNVEPQLQIESYLEQIEADHRDTLLQALIELDIQLRTNEDQDVQPQDYESLGASAVEFANRILADQSQDDSMDYWAGDVGDSPSTVLEPDEPSPTIGPYKLLQKVGEGGMGTVWMAAQTHPVQRRVALKVIKAGMDSKHVITRFEAERQALAMMDHPNIAKVLDAGTTDHGSPYFVMELVKGIPLTKYCDEHKLSIRERLELFVPVCKAVQHAHQKGIIHRDLKPSNVLVALQDGQPVPKVIDFGLAKALEHTTKLTDKTMVTELGKIVGTLQYMSPEQAETNALDIDTRSDVYSLGVMLYELLAGSTPLDQGSMERNALLQVLKIIREQDPPRPSHRLGADTDTGSKISDQRKIAPSKLQQILRGELDWIVMKAIEKDRQRRYDSASSFADDVVRYLNDDPVVARPPSTVYRMQKFVRKNKVAIAFGFALTISLVGGLVGSSWGWMRALDAEALASEKAESERSAKLDAIFQRDQANIAKAEAETLATRTKNVLNIVTDAFGSVNPEEGGDTEMSAKDVLFKAKEAMKESELDGEGKAELLRSLSKAFLGLGEFDDALVTASEEVEIRTDKLGSSDLETLRAMHNLAGAMLNRGQLTEGIKIQQFVYDNYTKQLGEQAPLTLEALSNLAEMHRENADFDKAIPMQKKLLSQLKAKQEESGRLAETTMVAMNNFAEACRQVGRIEEATELFRDTVELMENTLGKDHPQTLNTTQNLATCLQFAEKDEEADAIFKEIIPRMESKLGADHPITVAAISGLATSYVRANRLDEALPLLKKSTEQTLRKFGQTHARTITAQINLAFAYRQAGKLNEAIEKFREIDKVAQESLGESNPTTVMVVLHLASALSQAGDFNEAIDRYRPTLETLESTYSTAHPLSFEFRYGLANALFMVNKLDEAISLLKETMEINLPRMGKNNQRMLAAKKRLGEYLSTAGKSDESVRIFGELVDQYESTFGKNHFNSRRMLQNYGVELTGAGKYQEALERFKELRKRVDSAGENEPPEDIGFIDTAICALHLFLDDIDKGKEWRSEIEKVIDGRGKTWLRATIHNAALVAKQPEDFREVTQQQLKVLKPDSRELAVLTKEIGFGWIMLGDYESAVNAIETATRIFGKDDESDSWHLTVLDFFGQTTQLLTKDEDLPDDALKKCASQLKEVAKTLPGVTKIRIEKLVQLIVKRYQQFELPEQAAFWEEWSWDESEQVLTEETDD